MKLLGDRVLIKKKEKHSNNVILLNTVDNNYGTVIEVSDKAVQTDIGDEVFFSGGISGDDFEDIVRKHGHGTVLINESRILWWNK